MVPKAVGSSPISHPKIFQVKMTRQKIIRIAKVVLIILLAIAGVCIVMAFRYDNLYRKIFPTKATRAIRSEEQQLSLPPNGERYEDIGCSKDIYQNIHCFNSIGITYPDLSFLGTIRHSFESHGWATVDMSTLKGTYTTPENIYYYAKEVSGQKLCGRINTGGQARRLNGHDTLRVSVAGPGDDYCRSVGSNN